MQGMTPINQHDILPKLANSPPPPLPPSQKKKKISSIIFRAFQGIGGSGLYSLCQISLVEIFPAKPALIGALIGSTLAISFVLGPILGGVISDFIGWRYIFWIKLVAPQMSLPPYPFLRAIVHVTRRCVANSPRGSVPLGTPAMIVVPLFWPKERHRNIRHGLLHMDWAGIFLLLASSLLLIVGLQQGGLTDKSWGHPIVTVSLTVAAVAWIAFSIWEVGIGFRWELFAKLNGVEPVFPVRLAARRVYAAALL